MQCIDMIFLPLLKLTVSLPVVMVLMWNASHILILITHGLLLAKPLELLGLFLECSFNASKEHGQECVVVDTQVHSQSCSHNYLI